MTSPEAGLFDVPDAWRTVPPPPEDLTTGERLRRRQATAIAAGYHPLHLTTAGLRLLDQSDRSATKDNAAARGRRCGTCALRTMVNGGSAREWPKCGYGAPRYANGATAYARAPRYTSGAATDVRAWWPACVDYTPAQQEGHTP